MNCSPESSSTIRQPIRPTLDLLMAECTENEKRFIYEMVKASIDSMHKNGWHISDDEA